jgi:hypothetical protein
MATENFEWVTFDNETVEQDLQDLDGAPANLDLDGRTVFFVLRHYSDAKVADTEATTNGTVATATLVPDMLSRSGTHSAEWRIEDGANDPTTLPKDDPLTGTVRPSVHDTDSVTDALPENRRVDTLYANEVVTDTISTNSGKLAVAGRLDVGNSD